MKLATNIVKIPNGYGGFKWPTLKESYNFFYSYPKIDESNTHQSLYDVALCEKVLYGIAKYKYDK